MNFIDLHIHLQDYNQQYATDMVKKAQKCGLKKMLCNGTMPQDWPLVADYARKYPDLIVPAFGLHPWKVSGADEDFAELLLAYLQDFPSAPVGEVGIDGLKPEAELQRKYFVMQLEIAKEKQRPVIIHAVKYGSMLPEYQKILPPKFMFHSFNGRYEQMKEILRYGGYVSLGASIFKNRDAEKIIRDIPLNRILAESDGPYQPLPKEAISTPLFIPQMIKMWAEIRKTDADELAKQIYDNSINFIGIN